MLGMNLSTSTAVEVSSEASENQNDALRTLLPFTVDSLIRLSLGVTYITSPCST